MFVYRHGLINSYSLFKAALPQNSSSNSLLTNALLTKVPTPKLVVRYSLLSIALSNALVSYGALAEQQLEIEHEHHHEEPVEKIVVQATRSGHIANEQPVRVELINREEITEKATMRPGNISMKEKAFPKG